MGTSVPLPRGQSQVNQTSASWGCETAQLALQKACEQQENTKVSCVAGTFIFDITGLKSTSTLTCIPNNPFVTFPSPGSKCDMETLGYSKFKFTFACSPN